MDPLSTAPPTVAGVLPVIAGVLLLVEGVLMDGLLMTGAGGTIGAPGVDPTTDGALPTGGGVPIEGALPLTAGAPPVESCGELVTDGVGPTGDGVLPLIEGAEPETPDAGAPVVCARAGRAIVMAAASKQVRACIGITSLT